MCEKIIMAAVWIWHIWPRFLRQCSSSRLLNYSKQSRNTLCSRVSLCHPTIVLFGPGAHKPWLLLSYQWTMLAVELQCFTCSASLCQKLNDNNFQLVSVFQSSVTHFKVARAARQFITIKTGVCCARVCNFSIIICIVLVVVLIDKILWKSMVFLNFFWVV
jgi:hypothetical protein